MWSWLIASLYRVHTYIKDERSCSARSYAHKKTHRFTHRVPTGMPGMLPNTEPALSIAQQSACRKTHRFETTYISTLDIVFYSYGVQDSIRGLAKISRGLGGGGGQ